MANMVTRCPQCKTSFRITAAQLQTARGAVRCGACLHIFRAQDHLLGGAQQPPPASSLVRKPSAAQALQRSDEPAPTIKKTQPPEIPSESGERKLSFDQSLIDQESSLPDDDFLISDNMEQESEDDEDPLLNIQSARAQTSSLFEREIKDEIDDPEDAADESWAMNLLEEEEDEKQDTEQTRFGRETIDEFEVDQEELEAQEAFEATEAHSREQSSTFSLVEDNSDDSDSTSATGESNPNLRFHLTGSDSGHERESRSYISAYNSERNALLMGIDPEPVEMTWTQALNRRSKLIWAVLAVLAAALLVAQVAWLQFDQLSRIEPYRSFYASLCPTLGCELPKLVDANQIRATNVVIREHPEVSDALMVDVILLNNAPFEQPFPPLVLEFDNPNGEVVARRQFKPEEYLSGELSGYQNMPRNQPVHLTLELVDPGTEATGYRAYIPN